MNLSDLRPPAGSKHKRKRIGRGPGSGHGVTAGRGEKGQKSRAGYSGKRAFEGGQMPLVRRVPKRGFNNIFRTEFAIVNLSTLNEIEGDEFGPESLLQKRVIRKPEEGLKVLGDGDISRAIKISAHKFSKSAVEKIEKAGGTVTVLPAKEKWTRAAKGAKAAPTKAD